VEAQQLLADVNVEGRVAIRRASSAEWATASIDAETDQMMQRAVRTAFADRGVVTVAHRLDTVTDCDTIVMLDGGAVAEAGAPAELCDRALRRMLAALGDEQAQRVLTLMNRQRGDEASHICNKSRVNH
jgi:ABC-type multidrug transport system ATPase subunit